MFKTQNLYQNDPLWKSKYLGFSKESIGGWGCLLTSITMMLNGLGYNETPETVNEKMKNAGGFQEAFFIPSVLPYVFPNVMYKGIQPCEASPAPLSLIDAALAAGKPVILQVDWSRDAGIQTHFVLAKERVGEDYSLYDPYMYGGDGPGKEVLLTKRYKYQGATLDTEISGVLWWDGTVPPAPPEKKTVALPAEKFIVYAIEDDLSLRADPSTTGYLWKRMKAGTELISVEPKADAVAKIGKQGQWLKVQDPTGDQGYCAAWYVNPDKNAKPADATIVSAPAAASSSASSSAGSSAPKPVPAGALSLVPTEEMSFRTQPVVADSTMIRRVPPTEKFIALELPDAVVKKVGVQGQWINVRDQNNKDGYVAAWYVKYASGSTAAAATPAAAAPAPAGSIKVKASVEGVAFRKQAVISDASLIKRVPIYTEFIVTEAGGEKKVGLVDQWIKVKDSTGVEGYVAAWFVTR
jgi:hypothetical protein